MKRITCAALLFLSVIPLFAQTSSISDEDFLSVWPDIAAVFESRDSSALAELADFPLAWSSYYFGDLLDADMMDRESFISDWFLPMTPEGLEELSFEDGSSLSTPGLRGGRQFSLTRVGGEKPAYYTLEMSPDDTFIYTIYIFDRVDDAIKIVEIVEDES